MLLDEIVREELRPILEPLIRSAVRELVAEHVNGANNNTPATKVCVACGQAKALSEYETGRSRCRVCRREQVRESKQRRRQEPDSEEGHSPAAG